MGSTCHHIKREKHVSNSLINRLNCVPLTTVKVAVILKTVHDKQKYVSLSKERMADIVGKFLRKIPVKTGSVLSCSETFLGLQYKCHSINVCETIPDDNSSHGILTSETHVEILSVNSHDNRKRGNFSDTLKEDINSVIKSATSVVNKRENFLLSGPSDSDMSSIVKHIAMLYDAWLIEINTDLFKNGYVCSPDDQLNESINIAVNMPKNLCCMIYIENLERFCRHANLGTLTKLERLTNSQCNGSGNILVCASTSAVCDVDFRWIKTLFRRKIIIETPKRGERYAILKSLLDDADAETDMSLELVANATAGDTEDDLRTVVALALQKPPPEEGQVVKADFSRALRYRRSMSRHTDMFVDAKPVSWDEIGGHDAIKAQLIQAAVWPLTHPESFYRLGEYPPKGILLTGPPGCGKTKLVRAMASANNINFLSVSAAQLYSPYVGDSEKKMFKFFQQAQACAPAFAFVDELDSVIGSRSLSGNGGKGEGGVNERVLSTMLTSLDGVGSGSQKVPNAFEVKVDGKKKCYSKDFEDNVLFVAASNRPDMIDKALRRPGRIDRIIYVPPPCLAGRVNILRVYTKDRPTEELDLEEIARRTEKFTGADLENLCKQAFLLASSEESYSKEKLHNRHFHQVLMTMRPTLY